MDCLCDFSQAGACAQGVFFLAAVELWERFSYYGMRASLVLYLQTGGTTNSLVFVGSPQPAPELFIDRRHLRTRCSKMNTLNSSDCEQNAFRNVQNANRVWSVDGVEMLCFQKDGA